MPGIDGATLVPLLRDIEPDLPVVTMSGLAPPVDDDLPAHQFLSKPFRADDLLARCRPHSRADTPVVPGRESRPHDDRDP